VKRPSWLQTTVTLNFTMLYRGLQWWYNGRLCIAYGARVHGELEDMAL